MSQDYSYIKEQFKWWLARAESERPREVSTQKEFAAKYVVSEQTLINWKKDPKFREEVTDIRKERLRDRMTGIIDALAEKAEKGDVYAIQTVLKYLGEFDDKIKVENNVNILSIGSSFSPEQIVYLVDELVADKRLRRYNIEQDDLRVALERQLTE